MTTVPVDPAGSARLAALDASGWGHPFKLYQPRNLAFWVYALILLSGVVALVTEQVSIAGAYGPALLAGTIWFALYTVPFWWFIRYLDRYTPQPTSITVAAFAWGGLAATFAMAQTANDALRPLYGKLFGQAFALDWGAGLTAPFTEEFAKAAGLILLITLAPRLVRSAFDGLVLGAYIGLGFQVFESVSYAWHQAQAWFGAEQLGAAAQIIGLRSITGLTAHWLYSAVFCAGLVYVLGRPTEPRRLARGIAFILAAMLAHGAWDAVGALSGGGLSWFLWTFAVMVASVVLLVVVYRTTVPREREWLREIMAPEVTRGVITEEELAALSGSRRQRRRLVRSAKGHRARKAQKRVLEAARDLAGDIAQAHGRDTGEVEFARAEVARVRGTSAGR